MNNLGKILILDDKIEWQEALRDLLEQKGYSADVAGTYEEAIRCFSERIYHVAILDIRLKDGDPSNTGGMDLLRNLSPLRSLCSLGIIILSAFGTKPQMREAFSQFTVDDFQEKDDFDKTDFINKIQAIFSEKVRINLNLSIEWLSGDAVQATSNLRFSDNTSIKKKSLNFQKLIADELNDLLMRLFNTSKSILLKPLKAGQSGSQVLWAKAFDPEMGGTAQLVVKFGDIKTIETEKENFEKYINPYVEGGRHTSVINVRYNQRLGGIVYKLLGTSDERLVSFSEFYQTATVDDVQEFFENLFLETCYSWYKNPGVEHPLNLTHLYLTKANITKEKLEGYLKGLKVSKSSDGKLTFKDLDEEVGFINPLNNFIEKDITIPTYKCIVHGDLNAGNILVDKSKKAWLIDFGGSEIGHILRDFAELDSVIRFQLLTGEQASLSERLYLEKSLVEVENFNQLSNLKNSFHTENEHLSKAFLSLINLRMLAAQILPNKKSDFSEYQITLFFYALSSIRFASTLETVQRQHALLSASVLAEHLKQRGVYG
jgi:DNA-binding response OmpR family regulator